LQETLRRITSNPGKSQDNMLSSIKQDFSKKKAFLLAGFIGLLAILILLIAFLRFKSETIHQFRQIQSAQNINTVFYDIDQRPFHIIRGAENRKYVQLQHVSRNLQKAVVAVEDARFFTHPGFDPIRIIAVIFKNLNPNTPIQGASTITQQLVKLTLLSPEQTFKRKLTELFMSMALEVEYSKTKILEFYLNKVYLGHRNYGIENASLNYFHKSTKDLTIAEAAFIAGLIKKPEGYSPFVNLKKARDRQLLVLKRMRTLDWITPEEHLAAVNEHLLIRESRKSDLQIAPYFVSHILHKMKQKYGHKLIYGGGLHIYTTLDSKFQKAMEKVVGLRMAEEKSFEEIAGVSIDPATGFVKALVGGNNFFKSEFNRVTQARRQPGSSFKPFVYATALAEGIKPNNIYWDEPTQYSRVMDDDLEVYEPGNFTGEHLGPITVTYALKTSNNVVSVKILNEIGIEKLIPRARLFGLDLPGDRGLCLALGCGEITLLNLVNAYTVFANQGYRNEPVFVLKVTDSRGSVMERYEQQPEIKAISVNTAFQMNRMLQNVVNGGTGKNAAIQTTSGGKTGTSDQNRDAWYVGYTANLVSGFWIGNDDNTPMDNEVGGKTPARLWKAYMNSLPKLHIQKEFAINEAFEDYLICDHSGKLATAWCPSKSWYPLKRDEAPAQFCDYHSDDEIYVDICRSSGKLATRHCPVSNVESKRFVTGTEPGKPCDVHNRSEYHITEEHR
jgi:penicillin-binding protein 1A